MVRTTQKTRLLRTTSMGKARTTIGKDGVRTTKSMAQTRMFGATLAMQIVFLGSTCYASRWHKRSSHKDMETGMIPMSTCKSEFLSPEARP